MQMCMDCGSVYDESEYCKCPFCNNEDVEERLYIVYDRDEGSAKTVPECEKEKYNYKD